MKTAIVALAFEPAPARTRGVLTSKWGSYFAFGWVVFSAAACGGGASSSGTSEDGPTGKTAESLYIRPNTPLFTNNNNVVPWCWVTPGYDAQKALIRSSIETTWLSVANIAVNWVADCASIGQQPFVRVAMDTSTPITLSWSWGMVNLSVNAPSVSFSLQADGSTDSAIPYLAVREFGHVLGFADERDKPDPEAIACRTQYCNADAQGNPQGFLVCMVGLDSGKGGISIGPYDSQSVMNSCGPLQGVLSPGDIAGVIQVYGPKVPYCKKNRCPAHSCGTFDDGCGGELCCTSSCPGRTCLPDDLP